LKKLWLPFVSAAVIAAAAYGLSMPTVEAQNYPAPSELKHKVDLYLRYMFAFGPDVKLVVGDFRETGVPGLLETDVAVTIGENKEDAKMWVSKDGKFLMRGELNDMSKDVFAENRAKLDLKNAPSNGRPGALITMVEFADFQCPVCKQLHDAMRGILPNYPQVQFAFKDFPLEQIHPWARTGALAGRCAYQQDPQAFWKMYDSLYDNQDLISTENAWAKVKDYAGRNGLNVETFNSCMTSPEAAAAVNANIENGKLLEVTSTPTLFVNGRRIVGADPHQLEQILQYELLQITAKKN
jgi:protein-disulfide isomerase